MSVDTRNLSGARASSAVRCIAKATHEAIGTPRDEEAQAWLQKHFRRGVNVGRAWASGKAHELHLEGHTVTQKEWPIPWGLGWEGHADLIDPDSKTVYEAYHAAGGAFREEKALQAAFYADELGPDWKAELAVIDTTDVSDEEGFAVQPYEINVDGLRGRVRDIKQRVVTAVEAGAVNPADKVGDTPHHTECRTCPFAATCWAGWQPPVPDENISLETEFEALRILESDRAHAKAKLASIEEMRQTRLDAIRPYTRPGVPLDAGTGITIRRTEVAGRVTFQTSAYLKAGHTLTPEQEAFVKVGEPSERWSIGGPA